MQWIMLHLNLAGLSYSSRLLLALSILAAALWLVLTAGLHIVGMWSADAGSTSYLARWMNSKHVAPRARHAINKWIPITSSGIAGYILGAASIFAPVRELHMVEVLSKNADRVYTISVPAFFNKPIQQDTRMTIRLCPHGDDLPLKTGMVMEPFQYIQGTDCLLINGSTYVGYLRDANRNVIDINGNILFAKEN